MNQAIATKAAHSRPDVPGPGRIAAMALAMMASCGGTVGFENPPSSTTVGDWCVVASTDASPGEPPVDASVADKGTDDDPGIQRPPAKDTGVPVGPRAD